MDDTTLTVATAIAGKPTDKVLYMRSKLIRTTSDATLRALLDDLQTPTSRMPPVITSRERNEVLQKNSVTEDQVTCLVDMVQKKGEKACERFLNLLKEKEPGLEDQSFTLSMYKKTITSFINTVREKNSQVSEDTLLTDRYTELLIVQRPRRQKERKESTTSKTANLFNAKGSKAYKCITVDQFFSPDDNGDDPKAVILQGESGYGKSFAIKKIIIDWASGNLYQDQFELLLYLDCRKLSGKMSVVDLVCDYSHTTKYAPLITQKLKESPDKVLFLIDGIDGFQFPKTKISDSFVKDPYEPAPVAEVLSSLLKGHILNDCFLLITCRAAASDYLSKLLKAPKCSCEIHGFSEKGIHEYFQKFCQDEKLPEDAFCSVKANHTLLNICQIPFICWLVCKVLKYMMEEKKNALETTTSIFVEYVSNVLGDQTTPPLPTLLKSLSTLAKSGEKENRIINEFDKKTVERHLSKVSDPASLPFLHKFYKSMVTRQKEMFKFMHLNLQEFFTALYYTLDENQDQVNRLLSEYKDKSSVSPVIKFLFGLSNSEVMKNLEGDLALSCGPKIRTQLEEWILQLIKNSEESQKTNMMTLILHCLYELHEAEFVEHAMGLWGEIKFDCIPLSKTDCWVLRYCLQCCPTFRGLDLTECNITAEKLRMLHPVLGNCNNLGLDVENLSDADVSDLISAVGKCETLTNLCVENSDLSDESVQQVLRALSNKKSVGVVLLSVKTITKTTAENLLQFTLDTEIGQLVGVYLPEEADGAESLCTFLAVGRDKEDENCLWLRMDHKGDFSLESETLGLGLRFCLPAKFTDSDKLLNVVDIFHQQKPSKENIPEYAHRAVMESLVSLPGLKKVELWVSCLTESWASSIVSLIHNCPTVEEISLEALVTGVIDGDYEEADGLLLEEGIRLLQETQKRQDCTISLTGKRCRKDTDQCNEFKVRNRDCNHKVDITMKGESYNEEEAKENSEEEGEDEVYEESQDECDEESEDGWEVKNKSMEMYDEELSEGIVPDAPIKGHASALCSNPVQGLHQSHDNSVQKEYEDDNSKERKEEEGRKVSPYMYNEAAALHPFPDKGLASAFYPNPALYPPTVEDRVSALYPPTLQDCVSALYPPTLQGHPPALYPPTLQGHPPAWYPPTVQGHAPGLYCPTLQGHAPALYPPTVQGHAPGLYPPTVQGHTPDLKPTVQDHISALYPPTVKGHVPASYPDPAHDSLPL
ncbi:NACHT, LRR and PYD domains-containing protein 1 homolog isoform X2 [Sardina pilchardus]|uniref:NACHT, LRR and PYD domains-containing protein 1 homolog isoform X2 n=1 Tax=Sardina pilchardus TaxID=27697 RepID=UPI002E13BE7B